MPITCRQFKDLIESYLADELSEIKKEAFEAHYFQCDGCFADLKMRERLYSGEIPIPIAHKKKVPWWQWNPLLKPALVMASLVVIVLSALWVIGNYREGKYLESISQVEMPVYIQAETRDNSPGSPNQTFEKAMAFYNTKQYGAALKLLNTIEPQDKGKPNPQVIFFKAVCNLEIGDLKAAVTNFDKLIAEKNPSYYDDAVFYKGIALLRLKKKKQALEQFQILAGWPGFYSFYASRAISIMEKLAK